jgi:hypothetical protein
VTPGRDAEAVESGIDALRQMPLRFDVDCKWKGGNCHSFVGADLMQFRNNGQTLGARKRSSG